jgi:predicted transcriptional regulator
MVTSVTPAKKTRRSKVLKIGILSREAMRERTSKIARGELKPKPSDPRVWVPSMETVGKILSGKNQELLAAIREHQPASISALAERTGRAPSNLSRTLKTLSNYGLVNLRKHRGKIKPIAPYGELDIRILIADQPVSKSLTEAPMLRRRESKKRARSAA